MVEASGAAMRPHKHLVPAVPLAVLREALLWLKAAQDQPKGRGHLPSIPVTALGRQGNPWQIGRYKVSGIENWQLNALH